MKPVARIVTSHIDLPKQPGQKLTFMLQLACGHAIQLPIIEKLNWPVGHPVACWVCSTQERGWPVHRTLH